MQRHVLAVVPGGLDQNEDLKRLLTKLKRTLDAREVRSRWNPPHLWHVTLKFLSEIARPDLLPRALETWRPNVTDPTYSLEGLGVFPTPEAARVLWLGVRASQGFYDLQRDLEDHLARAGITTVGLAPARPYRPHLTLARFRNPLGCRDLLELGGRAHFGTYRPTEVVLFDSGTEGRVRTYLPRLRYPL